MAAPWKERVCEEVRPFAHGTVCGAPRYPHFLGVQRHSRGAADEHRRAGRGCDQELADCPHRLADWVIPMSEAVAADLRERGWVANPLIFMLHDGRGPGGDGTKAVEVDYDAVLELRDIWHREDFGDHAES